MKLLIDVNLPPRLAEELSALGIESEHWVTVGEVTAPDRTILDWARAHECIVVTQDLDFPDLLATTAAKSPSVVLIRNVAGLSRPLASHIHAACAQCADALHTGAIVVLDARGLRLRVLPIEG